MNSSYTLNAFGGICPSKRRSARTPRRLPLSIALAAALSIAYLAPAEATTYTWTGQVDAKFGNGQNWGVPCIGGNGQPTTCFLVGENGPWNGSFPAGSELYFNNNSNTSITGLPSGNLLDLSFTFGSNAGAFTFNPGSFAALALKGSIKNNSSKLQTFKFRFDPKSDQTWDGGAGGLQLWNFGDLNNSLTLKNKVNLVNLGDVSTKVGTTGTGTLNIGVSSSLAAPELIIGEQYGGDGTVNLSASDATLNLGGSLYVGRGGTGVLNISSGQVSAYQAFFGFDYGSQGTVLIDGAASKLTISAGLDIGRSSTGTLTVQNGGTLSSGNSVIGKYLGGDGLVTLSGAGSSWVSTGNLGIGDAGIGSLAVVAGAKLSNVSATLGIQDGSVGTAKITGANSSWLLSGDLQVGNLGEGSLFIEQGGLVSNRHTYVGVTGDPGTSKLMVSGAGSRLQSSGNLVIQSGILGISDGGAVTAKEAHFGDYSGAASALVNLAGTGSTLTVTSQLGIGGDTGTATLNIGAGAAVNSGGLMSVGKGGVLNLNGGMLTVGSAINAGQINWNTGTVNFLGSQTSGVALLDHSVGLGVGMNMNVAGTLSIQVGDDFSLNGGQASAQGLFIGGDIAVGSFSQLSVGAGGVSISGALQLAGGSISSSGAIQNDGYLSGYGVIGGTGSFSNSGLLQQGTGTLVLGTSGGGNLNTGSWELQAGRNLRLDSDLENQGSFTLNGGNVTGAGVLLNGAQGTISGSGRIAAASFINLGALVLDQGQTKIDQSFVNRGQILLGSNSATLAGGQIGNHGLIQGLGKINNNISNIDPIGSITAQGGTLTLSGVIVSPNAGLLSANSGATLLINQGLASNAGRVQLAGGTFDNNNHALSNEAAGVISGYGTLRGGLLTNAGHVLLSGGSSAIYTPVLSTAGSQIIASGNSNTTFYGTVDVQSGAELRVSTGSVATFFGTVQQRTGSKFTGAGSKRFEGTLTIGASPGLGTDEGDVEFGDSSSYLAEIGGTTACTLRCATDDVFKNSSFDKYVVVGNLSLGGTLKLTSWNGFVAQKGQSFDLLDWGTLTGTFANIDASGFKLAAGTQLDYSQLYTNGSISVTVSAVPEPSTLALWLAGIGAVGSIAKRRGRQSVTV